MLPFHDLPTSVKAGELSRNMAYAFKSEIALQAAAYETDVAKKKEWLKASIAAADAVEGASLGSNYGNIFNEKDPYSSEIIFAIYRDKANTNTDAIAPLQNVMPNTNNDNLVKKWLRSVVPDKWRTTFYRLVMVGPYTKFSRRLRSDR